MSFFDPILTRRILGLSAPVMLAMLTQTLINQVDHVLVGHLPQAESTPGQTALQISVILLWAFGGMLAAISVGTQALAARRIGAGDIEGAGAVSTNSQLLAVVASIIVTAFTYAMAPKLFRLMNKDPAVIALGVPFLRWRFLQITSMVWTASLKSFFDGLGKTRVHMGVAIVMNIANFLMCIAFIYGPDQPGIPVVDGIHSLLLSIFGDKLVHMGVPGAGLASMLSSYVGLFIMLGWSLRGEYRKFHIRRVTNASASTIWQIAKLSVPSGIATMFAMGGFGFVLYVVSRLDHMAGHGVGRTIFSTATSNIINVLQIVFISCLAYGTATATLVSQNMGATEYDLAERFAYQAARIGAVLFLVLGLILAAWAEPILHFWNPDPDVIAVGAPILRVLGFFCPLISVALVFTQALYGAGNTMFVMVAEGILHFSCLIPMSWLAGITFGLGMWGVWGSLIFYIAMLAVVMFIEFRRGHWKHIRI
ncbi:MAG TPA: MATE family efflux transporter [Pseudomonadota bacterium]|nr:MATE family efflux transporter [Pseudomonadota bacterium]